MRVYVVWYTDSGYTNIAGVFTREDKAQIALDNITWYDSKGIRESTVTP